MTERFNQSHVVRLIMLVAGVPLALMACTAQVRVAAPAVYVPPPPAAVVAEPDGVVITATEAPPPLPDYEQPACPGDGFLWTPGYWAWGDAGYYWVPGTWVRPPRVGLLWTPGYWGFVGGAYVFHAGYWGPHVGFYGGINYGFGYVGVGFAGGRWVGGEFAYNRTVTNINTTVVIHNTYNETVVNNVTVNRVSFNGGRGGVMAAPTAEERMAAREQHVAPTVQQAQHVQQAARTPELAARANGGHPTIAATPRPAAFHASGVVGARGAAAAVYHPPSPEHAGTNANAYRPYANAERPNAAINRPNAIGGNQARTAHARPNGPHNGKPNNKRPNKERRPA